MKNYLLKSGNGSGKSPAFMVSIVAVGLLTFTVASPVEAALIHRYELDGSFEDALGGPDLVPGGPNGSGMLNATGYSFEPDQGLSLANAVPSDANYSILLDFRFSDVADYRRIVDFKNLSVDDGLYVHDSALNFYPAPSGDGPSGVFQADVLTRLVITRDSATKVFRGYVNGVQQIQFTDGSGLAVFNGPNNVIHFFSDNIGSGEASAGVVERIEVYDSPLSFAQVSALGGPSPVPEPSAVALSSLGFVALAVARYRARLKWADGSASGGSDYRPRGGHASPGGLSGRLRCPTMTRSK